MVNYKGKTAKKDGGEFYTEIVAKTILENIEALEGIEPVKRTEDYWSSSRDCSSYKPDGVRGEEMTAMELRMQGKISGLGEIMDYQVPLKNTINDKAGKIDVLSFDSNGVMRILELKRKGNREDTLLRCVLEAYTYFKRVEQEKLRSEYAAKAGAPCSCLKACPIFFEDSRQYDEYTELDARPNLKALMKALEIELILLEGTYPNYSAKILPY
ncbi:MAG: hypothetical protein IJO88_08885 [Oscillospiraceae bacterium]|nr:hypothetical protein [Oscillospiraceae bacterium]